MRVMRIAGVVAAGAVLLVFVGAVLLWLFVDPNDYKPQIRSSFKHSTGRELRLDGPLKLSVFPWLALETGAASIANRDGFGDEPLVSLEHARIGVRLWPLLTARRVEMGRVSVDGLHVNLQVARDGRDNWSDFLDRVRADTGEDASGEAKDTRSSSPAADLGIAGMEFRNARLSFDDRKADSRYVVDHWNFDTGRLQRGRPFDVTTSLEIARNGSALGKYAMSTRVDLTSEGRISLVATKGKIVMPAPAGSAAEPSIDLESPRILFDTTSHDMSIEALEARIGDARLKTTLQVRQGGKGPTVTGPFELAETSPRKLLQTLGVTPPATRDGAALGRIAATSQLSYSSRLGLKLASLDARIDDTHLTGEIAVPDLGRKTLRFKLRGDALNVDRYLPPATPAGTTSAGPPTPSGSSPDRMAALRALDLQGTLGVRKVIVAGSTFEDLKVGMVAGNGRFTVDPVAARAFGGSTSSRLLLDVRGGVPALHVDQQFSNVDVADLLAHLVDVRQLQGRGNATFSIDTTGSDLATLLRNVQGPFDLSVEDGAINGVDLWFEIERAVAAARKQASALTARGSGRTEFKSMRGKGTISNRTLHNDHMEFVSDFAHVTGRGNVDYGANKLQLDLKARLLKAPEGRLLGVQLSRVEGTDIPLKVTGSIEHPKVQPDVTALLGVAAKSTLTEPLQDKLKKKLEKLFKF